MLKCSKLDLCIFDDINVTVDEKKKTYLVKGNVPVHDSLQDETVSSGTFCTFFYLELKRPPPDRNQETDPVRHQGLLGFFFCC